jgi:sulfotransferase
VQNGIHFISGLPRSGTTLLSALLLQNPRFHAGVTTGVFQLLTTVQPLLSARSEFHTFINDTKRLAVQRGIITNYYDDVHREKVVFDTNRLWTSKLATIAALFPKAKVICCVRSVSWILDSIERLLERNPLEASRLFNFDATTNVYTRAEMMTSSAPTGFIGGPYSGLREAFYGSHSDKLILVTYDSLTRAPESTLAAIYDFIGEPPHAHDLKNVQFSTDVYDASIGLAGLHRVTRAVEHKPRKTILPPDLFQRHEASEFWKDPGRNPNRVKVI